MTKKTIILTRLLNLIKNIICGLLGAMFMLAIVAVPIYFIYLILGNLSVFFWISAITLFYLYMLYVYFTEGTERSL
jgi:Ca2+/Na+ antiporter